VTAKVQDVAVSGSLKLKEKLPVLLLEGVAKFESQRTLTVEGMPTPPLVITEKAAVQVIPCDGNRHTEFQSEVQLYARPRGCCM
jgi:hypothetical protein